MLTISFSFSLIITIATPIRVRLPPNNIFKVIVSSNPSKILNYVMTNAFMIARTGANNVRGVILDTSYFVNK